MNNQPKCPRCGGEDFTYEDQEVGNGETYEVYSCTTCGNTRRDVYVFKHVEWEVDTADQESVTE